VPGSGFGGIPVQRAAASDTPYINIQDQKANATDGGTFTSGAWRTRDLNTIQSDLYGLARVSSNQITLPGGTYRAHIMCPATSVSRHMARLQNITAGTTLLWGSSMPTVGTATGTSAYGSNAIVTGLFILTDQTVLEVQHQCGSSKGTDGFGFGTGNSFTVDHETFTVAEFWKLR
jgi:hypothetical protein